MTSILDTKSPLLWRACLAGEVAIMEKVMDQGVDPRKMDRNGESCLHMCARSGEVEAFERMVREGLNPDTPNHNGQTPLHVAVSKGHTGMVRHIVRNGGNTDLKSKFSGMTALHLSCIENDSDIASFLLDNGANCAVTDVIGKYADDYTQEASVLKAFESHFPVCTHGRKADKGSKGRKEDVREKPDVPTPVVNSVNAVVTRREESREETKRGRRESDGDDDENEDEEDVEKSRMKRKDKKRSSKKREKGQLAEREGKEIYDKMEHYNVERAKGNWNKAKQGGKKIKVNHSLGFSSEHKERMAQNVFDRLMGGKKK